METSVPKSKKSPPMVRIGYSDYEKKIPIEGLEDVKVGKKVCVIIEGTIVGTRKDKYGESVEIEMDEAVMGTKKDIKEVIGDY